MAAKLRVLQRGKDMVLAEHYTPVHGGRLTATTLETVTFDRPHRAANEPEGKPGAARSRGVRLGRWSGYHSRG